MDEHGNDLPGEARGEAENFKTKSEEGFDEQTNGTERLYDTHNNPKGEAVFRKLLSISRSNNIPDSVTRDLAIHLNYFLILPQYQPSNPHSDSNNEYRNIQANAKSHPAFCRLIINELRAHDAEGSVEPINQLIVSLERIEAEAELESWTKENNEPTT